MTKKKKITLISLILIVAFLITGFAISTLRPSRKSSNTEKVATTETKKLSEVKESDVESLLPELDDSYVVTGSDASVIAPTSDKEDVGKITADTSKVDFSSEGTYPVTYTVQLKKSAVKKALESNAASSKSADTSEKNSSKKTTSDKKNSNSDKKSASDQSAAKTADNAVKVEDDVKNDYIEVKVDKTIDVVSPEKAAELTAQGSLVLGYTPDENAAVTENGENTDNAAASEDAAAQEAGQNNNNGNTASNTAVSGNGSNPNKNSNTANAGNNNKGTDTKKNTVSIGNNASAKAGNSNKAASSSGSSKPAACQHNWVARTHVVHHNGTPEQGHWEKKWVRTEQKSKCNGCGQIFDSYEAWGQHSDAEARKMIAAGEDLSKPNPHNSSTDINEPIYENVYVVDKPATDGWDETVTDGYYCTKCGATK